jgi:hypothetical protein
MLTGFHRKGSSFEALKWFAERRTGGQHDEGQLRGDLGEVSEANVWRHSTAGIEHAEFARVFLQIRYFYIERSYGSENQGSSLV